MVEESADYARSQEVPRLFSGLMQLLLRNQPSDPLEVRTVGLPPPPASAVWRFGVCRTACAPLRSRRLLCCASAPSQAARRHAVASRRRGDSTTPDRGPMPAAQFLVQTSDSPLPGAMEGSRWTEDADARDKRRRTALMRAAMEGGEHSDTVARALIARGADPEMKDARYGEGKTALLFAAESTGTHSHVDANAARRGRERRTGPDYDDRADARRGPGHTRRGQGLRAAGGGRGGRLSRRRTPRRVRDGIQRRHGAMCAAKNGNASAARTWTRAPISGLKNRALRSSTPSNATTKRGKRSRRSSQRAERRTRRHTLHSRPAARALSQGACLEARVGGMTALMVVARQGGMHAEKGCVRSRMGRRRQRQDGRLA